MACCHAHPQSAVRSQPVLTCQMEDMEQVCDTVASEFEGKSEHGRWWQGQVGKLGMPCFMGIM